MGFWYLIFTYGPYVLLGLAALALVMAARADK